MKAATVTINSLKSNLIAPFLSFLQLQRTKLRASAQKKKRLTRKVEIGWKKSI